MIKEIMSIIISNIKKQYRTTFKMFLGDLEFEILSHM